VSVRLCSRSGAARTKTSGDRGDSRMTSDQDSTFQALRDLLAAYADGLTVETDTTNRFCLVGIPGPATLEAWRGTLRRASIPVAWVERRKSDVGYHLMGISENASLVARLSPALRARMHGKTCFNFQRPDADLLRELRGVTEASLDALRRRGFVEAGTE